MPEISRITGIPKTTVFQYIKNVEVLPEFRKNWLGKRGGSRKLKLLKEARALEEAEKLFRKLSEREKLLFVSALYWAEGSKKDFGLSNTDPELIRVFTNGIRGVFGIPNDRLRVSVRLYEDVDIDKSLLFWSEIVGIPKEKFVSTNVLTGKKKGKLQFGMCRVRVAKGGDILKKIVGINKVVGKLLSL